MEEYEKFRLSLVIDMAVNCMRFTLTDLLSFQRKSVLLFS